MSGRRLPHQASILAFTGIAILTCGCERLERVGQPPPLSPVGQLPDAVRLTADDVVKRLPTPAPPPALPSQPGSLWQTGSQNFLYDNRAAHVGDVLTVLININEKGTFENQTKQSRDGSDDLGVTHFLGLESKLNAVLPNAVDPSKLFGITSKTADNGNGRSKRDEQVQLKLAAIVTAILPNGNFIITGSQEMRMNFDLRQLQVAGIVRPQDITAQNTISYEKIAEARIAYGGRGQLIDLQQPRYGKQLLDTVLPF